jgi:IMP dehydrogenase
MEEKNANKKAYTFSDVLIVPKYSEIESRRNVDLSSDFGGFKMELPIFSANMKSVTEEKMAIAMSENGGIGILHRFCSIENAVKMILSVKNHFENAISNGESYSSGNSSVYFKFENKLENKFMEETGSYSMSSTIKPVCKKDFIVGVSIGVQEEDKERFSKLYDVGARIFVIDIANGFCKLMKDMVCWIKSQNLKDIHVIGGNIATAEGAYELAEWGVNCVKVGIGPGSACLTRKNTGIGVPQLYALETVCEEFKRQGVKDVKIISDGGMNSIGDIAKSLKFADACMLGSMVSGTTETPGMVFTNEKGEFYKTYMGSASGENKLKNGGGNEFVEGVAKTILFRGHVRHILKHIRHGLQSSFSYVGANNLKEFQEKCEFIEITSGGRTESKL